jgi:hypothetical protein
MELWGLLMVENATVAAAMLARDEMSQWSLASPWDMHHWG